MRLLLLIALLQTTVQDLEKRRDALGARLEELRGLKFKTALKVREATRKEYAVFALANARRVYGEDLGAAEKGLKALGLVSPKLRLELALTAQAGLGAKVFCSEGDLLVLDPGVADDLFLNKMDLGLVDQHYSPKVAPTYDGQMALAALRMGDAEIAKHLLWYSAKLPADHAKKAADEVAQWEKADSYLASAVVPRVFVRTGDFSWRRGAAFAAAIVAEGGLARLDRAWAEPPASTEQVIHPEKYLKSEAPCEIDLGAVDASLEASGYKPIYRTVLGELGAALFLETHFGRDAPAAASEGWAGDTFAVYSKEGAPALVVWATEWDTEKDAEEFDAQAIRAAVKLTPAETDVLGLSVRKKTAAVVVVNVPNGLKDGLLDAVWKSARKKGKRVEPYGE
jgi:hypothetical protein